jgi:RecA-family ATPase
MEGVAAKVDIQKNNIIVDSVSVKGKVYQVQIGKYNSKIPDGVLQTVKAMAAGKDIFRKTNEQGLVVYSIGNYNSIDEANRIKDNLVASGVSTAEVVTLEFDKK